MSFAQRLLESVVQLFRRELFTLLEIELHQLLVDLDDLIDDARVGFRNGGEIGLPVIGNEEAVRYRLATLGGQVDGQAFGTEFFVDLGEQPFQIRILRVDLVDDDHAAETAFGGRFHHLPGAHFDTGTRIDDDGGGLDGRERNQRPAEKIGIARCVQQVDVLALVIEARNRSVERVLVLPLLRVEVTDRGTAGDLALGGGGARLVK